MTEIDITGFIPDTNNIIDRIFNEIFYKKGFHYIIQPAKYIIAGEGTESEEKFIPYSNGESVDNLSLISFVSPFCKKDMFLKLSGNSNEEKMEISFSKSANNTVMVDSNHVLIRSRSGTINLEEIFTKSLPKVYKVSELLEMFFDNITKKKYVLLKYIWGKKDGHVKPFMLDKYRFCNDKFQMSSLKLKFGTSSPEYDYANSTLYILYKNKQLGSIRYNIKNDELRFSLEGGYQVLYEADEWSEVELFKKLNT